MVCWLWFYHISSHIACKFINSIRYAKLTFWFGSKLVCVVLCSVMECFKNRKTKLLKARSFPYAPGHVMETQWKWNGQLTQLCWIIIISIFFFHFYRRWSRWFVDVAYMKLHQPNKSISVWSHFMNGRKQDHLIHQIVIIICCY